MLNVYSGNVTTDDNGEACVALPDYFEALNQDFRYQLTVIGQFAQAIVAQEVRDNQFTVKTDQPRVKVSWQVTGTRQDRWAAANRMVVEEEKAAEEKGCYLHPTLWGQAEEAGSDRELQRENQLRQIGQLVPEQLRQSVEQTLLEDAHVDRKELQRLVAEAKRLAELRAEEEPPRMDRAGLEEQWRRVEELVQGPGRTTPPARPEQRRMHLRQMSQLVPEQLRQRVEQQLMRCNGASGSTVRNCGTWSRRRGSWPIGSLATSRRGSTRAGSRKRGSRWRTRYSACARRSGYGGGESRGNSVRHPTGPRTRGSRLRQQSLGGEWRVEG